MFEGIGIGVLTKAILWIFKNIGKLLKNLYQSLKARLVNRSGKYDKHYRKRHGQLKVSCIGMAAPRSLEDIYVAVRFLNGKSTPKYESFEGMEKALREDGEKYSKSNPDKRQDGMQVANDEQYLMVLGGPGIGKSTFLRKVGLEALKKRDRNFAHEHTPVFIELKRLDDHPIDIEALIIHELEICGYLNPKQEVAKPLKSGKFLILFDGLDEIPPANADEAVRKIEDFVDQYSQNRFIASCRIKAYGIRFKQFTDVEIADFDDSQIKTYIKKWFTPVPNQEMEIAEQCWEALKSTKHRSIKALARNPLSLAFLCIVYEYMENFPSNRAALYEGVFNIFLKKWTNEKRVRRDSPIRQYLNISVVKEMLSYIAAENFKANRLLFPEAELTNQIKEFCQRNANTLLKFDPSDILDTIFVDPGLFVERAPGVYSFFHLTFQEYLASNHFVSTKSIQHLISNHLYNEQGREVFLFAAELLDKTDDLLKAMEEGAAKSTNTDGFKTLFQWAEQITDTTDDQYNGITKRATAIHQYISLRLLNEIHEMVKEDVDLDLDFYSYLNRDFNINRYFNPYFKLEHYRDFYRDSHRDVSRNRDLYIHLKRDLDKNPDRYRHSYCNLSRYLHLYRDLYIQRYRHLKHNLYIHFYLGQDLYQYMDADFYSFVPSQFAEQFNKELKIQVTLIERIEQAKIFKGVDLQQMAQRFNEQREFIKGARAGKSVIRSEKSIHDTWLSILGITNEMLAIPHEELKNYVRYLRAMELIVACKRAARRVSPDIWQTIEDRFLTVDVADIRN